jgi:uncharacterized protein YdeI (BOF family)
MKRSSVLVPALTLFAAAAFFIAGPAIQLNASAIPAVTAQNQAADQSPTSTFAGKIVSQNGDRFILRDDANEVWYHLDDQKEAGKYFGKNVVVTGVLDGRTAMIRVRAIVEATS